ncbi:hypothetical protein TWF706_007659 [Orbilia oligospora]|uniref:Uncharacterized protein n=1 Tax=Orbilia oligospora TaxID=2813651 RepID=A0A7C8JPS9_ORBOL|nr:hypothetical protein TWF706_007659 [Orbilia oligospora]KAF3137947.1 hypothetical protein TWF703_004918 [Orbilia oligospora]
MTLSDTSQSDQEINLRTSTPEEDQEVLTSCNQDQNPPEPEKSEPKNPEPKTSEENPSTKDPGKSPLIGILRKSSYRGFMPPKISKRYHRNKRPIKILDIRSKHRQNVDTKRRDYITKLSQHNKLQAEIQSAREVFKITIGNI